MANEVVYTTYYIAAPNKASTSGMYGKATGGGEVLDIGTASAQLTGDVCRLQAKGTGFWFKFGESGVAATANTDGNDYLAAGATIDIQLSETQNYFDTAADA
jgi:hypothetical protein